jgi:hypothetical protein
MVATDETVRQRFMDTLSRARPKELAHDYLEREAGSDATLVSSLVVSQWEKERKADQHRPSTASLETNDLEARQQAAAERWLKGRRSPTAPKEHAPSNERIPDHDLGPNPEKESAPERTRGGPEEDSQL